ncbi:hypothetical protein JW948_08910 [bacterium]|nr:hypothetical protein [bacterium]
MMRNNGNKILVGIKINEKLRGALDESKDSVKHLFTGTDSEFLEILEMDSVDYIVKTITSGASLEELSNMCMNLKSILKMICPKFPIHDGDIKIYAQPKQPVRTYY